MSRIVNGAIDKKVTKRIDKLDEKKSKIEKRLTKLESERSKGTSRSQGKEEKNEYIVARKSLLLIPCQPDQDEVLNFLKKEMGIPREVIESLDVVDSRSIFERNLPPNKQKDKRPKTQMQLKTIDQWDIVMSYAVNLGQGANLKMVIPCHLKVTAKRLEHHAFKLRQQSKQMSGKDRNKWTKTQVCFDNLKNGLVLGV